MKAPALILASGSQSRAKLLQSAGLSFQVIPPGVDEDAVKDALWAEDASAVQCAEALAELKAVKVSQNHPAALVIGADQMLDCHGRWYDKPESLAAARDQLMGLAGKTHILPTVAVVALNGTRIWAHAATPRLTMRAFDEAFVTSYLERAGAAVLQSVGAYQLESFGAHLFQMVEGDFFTILGLPLLPLLAFLREHGIGLP